MSSKLAPALALSLACCTLAHAQNAAPCPSSPVSDHGKSADGKPLASPPADANVTLDGKAISIHYNAPSVRCRTIMGGLVPYGQVWRTGANPATSFTTETDLTIGNLHVPAGKYTLYTLPAAPGTPWQLIISKETGQWGTVYHDAQDLGRTPMQAKALPTPQETMSITFDHTTTNTTQLHIRWEKIDEWVEVKAAR
jgi:hypothetical protein